MDTTQIKNWDTIYDVVVLGFGGAGATAARFAADSGAKVLLVDSAPEGSEGGNTKVSAQMISTSDNFSAEKKYYKNLTYPMDLPEDMVNTYVSGMVDMPKYLTKYLGVKKPFSFRANFNNPAFAAVKGPMIANTIEYPEFAGSDHHDVLTVHKGFFDGALWKILRQKVLDRAGKIDVWYGSPAERLIRDPASKVVVGVQIKRKGTLINAQAKNGVVLTTGGFENDQEKIQDFLKVSYLTPTGGMYNQGAGVDMAQSVGASLWHMANFESLGMLHGLTFKVPKGKQGILIVADWPELYSGSVFVAGDDGSRYFKEDEVNRHGHLYNHGFWQVPQNQVHPHLVFDQKQFDAFKNQKHSPYPGILKLAVKAENVKDLADKIQANPGILEKTILNFNFFAQEGQDYAFNRDPEHLRSFNSSGPYYAVPLAQTMLNTQGGPRRNSKAEILDINKKPIPHLYGAGELGGINASQYNAGENIAECLIFGKIAGENASQAKEDENVSLPSNLTENKVTDKKLGSDLKAENFTTGPNQYLGKSNAGMGGEIVVRVTTDNKKEIKNIEVLKQSESPQYGQKILKSFPEKMIQQNTYQIDSVSGVSLTSKALKQAVKNALGQIPQGQV